MAQFTILQGMGALEVFPDSDYTSANVPASATAVHCQRGVRIIDEEGNNTPLRGLRVIITHNAIAATSPLPNVPYIWLEGAELRFATGYTYKFLDRGIIGYGISVAV